MSDKIRILFMGDSITDSNRTDLMQFWADTSTKNGKPVSHFELPDLTNQILGTGYPLMVASQLYMREPGKYEVLNRGINGNRIVDLDARIKSDCINLKPDILSILVGINGVSYDAVFHNGVSAEKFERVYDAMLTEIFVTLPDLKLILMEPYLLRGPITEEYWDYFSSQIELRRQVVYRLANKFGAKLLRTQELFDQAIANGNPLHWTLDGVHPAPAGSLLIANAWLKIFDEI